MNNTKELIERECYQCGRKKTALSHRSRCLTCETQRAEANEKENDDLRYKLAELQSRCDDLERDYESASRAFTEMEQNEQGQRRMREVAEQQISNLQHKNNELAAHVERIKSAWEIVVNGDSFKFMYSALSSTPQQSLAKHDAEVAREAYKKGFEYGHMTDSGIKPEFIRARDEAADQYAQQIMERGE